MFWSFITPGAVWENNRDITIVDAAALRMSITSERAWVEAATTVLRGRQSRSQSPQAFWSAVGCLERDWGNRIKDLFF